MVDSVGIEIPESLSAVSRSIQFMMGLPTRVQQTLVDEIQANSAEVVAKFSGRDVTIDSVAQQQSPTSVSQRTRIVSKRKTQVEAVTQKLLDGTETAAQQVASDMKMFLGLKVSGM
jgi:hypothetical protein